MLFCCALIDSTTTIVFFKYFEVRLAFLLIKGTLFFGWKSLVIFLQHGVKGCLEAGV